MTETERNDIAYNMSQRFAMAYILGAISNAYIEEGIDDMVKLRVYRHEAKRMINDARHYFDLFNTSLKRIFSAAGSDAFGSRVIADYEVLKETCDRYMNAKICVSAYTAWNDDTLREEGVYLCKVEGVTEVFLLRWSDKKWHYRFGMLPPVWRIAEGVNVVEVTDRIV